MESAKVSIINAPLASGADVSVVGSLTKITGLAGFDASLIQSYTWLPSLVTTKQVWAGSATVVAGNVYKFGVQIVVNGLINNYDFEHTATTSLGNNLKDAVDAWVTSNADVFGTDTVITTTGTSGSAAFTIAISGSTARPMVTAYEHTNVTITSNMTSLSSCTTSGTHLANDPLIITKAAHGLLTGTIVTCSLFDGGAAIINGKALRVVWASSSTFKLEELDGTPIVYGTTVTNATLGTVVTVAQEGLGAPDQVTADAAANGSTQTATVTGYHYKGLEMVVGYQQDIAPTFSTKYVKVRLWYPYNIDTAATTLYTNSASLQTALDGVVA
jgi:hypothetical protein